MSSASCTLTVVKLARTPFTDSASRLAPNPVTPVEFPASSICVLLLYLKEARWLER